MKQFLKENAVLTAGIGLPLALIAVFFVAGAISRASVAPPQYDMIFTGYYDWSWQIDLVKNHLTIRYREPDKSTHVSSADKPQLYRFDHKTMRVEPLSIDYGHLVNGVVQDPVIDELNTHVLSAETLSPDGYQLVRSDHSDGIFPELFGDLFASRVSSTNILQKDGRAIRLAAGPAYSEYAVLIAWVGEKKP